MKNRELKKIIKSVSDNLSLKNLPSNKDITYYSQKNESCILISRLHNSSKLINKILKECSDDERINYFKIINTYIESISRIILKNGGVISSYKGDQVTAIFTNFKNRKFLNSADLAFSCINAAMEIKKYELEFNRIKSKEFNFINFIDKEGVSKKIKIPYFEFELSLSYGEIFSGLIGASKSNFFKYKYEFIGIDIDITERILLLNQIYKSIIICTDKIFNLTDSFDNKLIVKKIDKVYSDEAKEYIQIYCIVGFSKELTTQEKEEVEIFNTAIEKFYKKDFANAGKLFLQANGFGLGDSLALFYAERCKYYIQKGIPSDWNGIVKLNEKIKIK